MGYIVFFTVFFVVNRYYKKRVLENDQNRRSFEEAARWSIRQQLDPPKEVE